MDERSSNVTALATASTILGSVALGAYVWLSLEIGKGFAIPVGLLAAVAATVVLVGPVGKALARRISGTRDDGVASEELDQVFARLEELEHSQARVAELEERLDFAERLLGQQREMVRLEKDH